jgi:hypothetical protein
LEEKPVDVPDVTPLEEKPVDVPDVTPLEEKPVAQVLPPVEKSVGSDDE